MIGSRAGSTGHNPVVREEKGHPFQPVENATYSVWAPYLIYSSYLKGVLTQTFTDCRIKNFPRGKHKTHINI